MVSRTEPNAPSKMLSDAQATAMRPHAPRKNSAPGASRRERFVMLANHERSVAGGRTNGYLEPCLARSSTAPTSLWVSSRSSAKGIGWPFQKSPKRPQGDFRQSPMYPRSPSILEIASWLLPRRTSTVLDRFGQSDTLDLSSIFSLPTPVASSCGTTWTFRQTVQVAPANVAVRRASYPAFVGLHEGPAPARK